MFGHSALLLTLSLIFHFTLAVPTAQLSPETHKTAGNTAQANTIELDMARTPIRARAKFTTTANTANNPDFRCPRRLLYPPLIDIESVKTRIQNSGDCKENKRFEAEKTLVLVCIKGKEPILDCATIAGMVGEIAQQCKRSFFGVDVADGRKFFAGTHSYVEVTARSRASC